MSSSSYFNYCLPAPSHNKRRHVEDYESLVSNLFKKQHELLYDPQWDLPIPTECFVSKPWHIKNLQRLKEFLNKTKSKLNNLDLDEWSAHTRKRNPSGHINKRLRDEINPEFLTQAWTKFYECANKYKIIPNSAIQENKLISLHLCEAPGAFIAALNHYLKTHYEDIEWNWRASTLNPYFEENSPSNMICDDRFMFHTLDHWDFGLDETGNIMDWENSQAIINNVKKLGKVMLVTADGSIDCIENPENQEDITSPLHYCEVVTALQALSEDGTFVFKLFTLFEHSTINLLYLLTHFFDKVNVFKPVTSKLGNSEVYVVCLKYKGSNLLPYYMPMLQSAYNTNLYIENSLFAQDKLPPAFLNDIYTCADMFSNLQCQVINNNLDTFQQKNMSYKHIQNDKVYVSAKFIDYYQIRKIDPSQGILKGDFEERPINFLSLNPKYHQGSYASRAQYHNMTPFEKVQELKITMERNIMEQTHHFMKNGSLQTCDHCVYTSDVKDKMLELQLVIGTPVSVVNSSKFIYSPSLKLYLKIVGDEDFRMIIFDEQMRMISIDEINNCQGDACNGVTNTHHLLFPNESCKETFDFHEKQCFNLLHEQLLKLAIGDDLYLSNLNLLSHFSVGVLNILMKFFEYIKFEKNFRILLKNLVDKTNLCAEFDKIASKLNSLQAENQLSSKQKTVLRILPVLQTNTGKMYHSIIFHNNQLYEHKCRKYFEIIENYMAQF